jgi:hypothetical protein
MDAGTGTIQEADNENRTTSIKGVWESKCVDQRRSDQKSAEQEGNESIPRKTVSCDFGTLHGYISRWTKAFVCTRTVIWVQCVAGVT